MIPQNIFSCWGRQEPVWQLAHPVVVPGHVVPQHTLPTQNNPVEQSPVTEHMAPCRLLKLAVTVAAAVTVRLHEEPFGDGQPDHDAKVPVPEAVAASVTTVPWFTCAEQLPVPPQLIPMPCGAVDATLPVPVGPATATWSRY